MRQADYQRAMVGVGLGLWLLAAAWSGAAELAGQQPPPATKIVQVVGPPAVKLGQPFGLEFDRQGNAYFVEMTGQRVRKLDAKGELSIIGGTGEKGFAGDDGPASLAQFNGMHNLAVGPDGTIYLADTWNYRVRAIDPKTGIIRTIAGTGQKSYSGDGGPAKDAGFSGVFCISLAPAADKLYVADLDNRRVRVIDLKTGIVTLVAGNGKKGVPRDGAPARDEPLVDPRAVVADRAGNVYILERGGHALRLVDAAGKIRTVAGTGTPGLAGDGGPALQAKFNGPKYLTLDRDGSVLICDTENHVIRRYLPETGQIVRVAGTGKRGTGGLGGPPLECELNQPHGVTVGPDGTLFICDSSNHRILQIVPAN
jgi:DNA-binding beta-propeller fold protein YncE